MAYKREVKKVPKADFHQDSPSTSGLDRLVPDTPWSPEPGGKENSAKYCQSFINVDRGELLLRFDTRGVIMNGCHTATLIPFE
jgi:hypothetical protein